MASVVASTTVKKENVTSGKSVEPVYSASSTSSVKMSSNETSKEEILQIKVLISTKNFYLSFHRFGPLQLKRKISLSDFR